MCLIIIIIIIIIIIVIDILSPPWQFLPTVGDKARTAKDGALDKASSKILHKLCEKYDDVNAIDKIAATMAKVQTVKLVMQENVDLALQNCVKLESIEKAAEDLHIRAGFFKRDAKELRRRMWWKNLKVRGRGTGRGGALL